MTNKNNEPRTEDLLDDMDFKRTTIQIYEDDLCSITEPTESWESLTKTQYEKEKKKNNLIKLGFAVFLATPILSIIYVIATK